MNQHARRIRIMAALLFVAALGIWRIFFMERTVSVVTAPPPPPQAASTAANISTPPADPVLDLFAPSEEALTAQHTQNSFTRQMEEAMVVTFLLRRCDLISEAEYAATYRDFVLYIQRSGMAADSTQAAARMQAIASAASASYSVLYGRVACTNPAIAEARVRLAAWRQGMARP